MACQSDLKHAQDGVSVRSKARTRWRALYLEHSEHTRNANWKVMCDFLLVCNCNVCPISVIVFRYSYSKCVWPRPRPLEWAKVKKEGKIQTTDQKVESGLHVLKFQDIRSYEYDVRFRRFDVMIRHLICVPGVLKWAYVICCMFQIWLYVIWYVFQVWLYVIWCVCVCV